MPRGFVLAGGLMDGVGLHLMMGKIYVSTLGENVSLVLSRSLMTLVFPASCMGCERELESDPDGELFPSESGIDLFESDHWCSDCLQSLQCRGFMRCRKCSAVLFVPSPFPGYCSLCFDRGYRFERALSLSNYQGLMQELVVQMKNQHNEVLATQLGRLLGEALRDLDWPEFDQLVTVPSHWWRRLSRGFHAAEIIAETVSKINNIRRSRYGVRLVRATKKQGMLSRQARLLNVRGAFVAHPKSDLKGQRILVVDDVMTTGATANEVARVLLNRGAAEVCVAVIARATGGG